MDNSTLKKNNTTENLLPSYYRTDSNKKFLQSTMDQVFQQGSVSKINGFIGERNSKTSVGSDNFIDSNDNTRNNYQLEPGLVIDDNLGNNIFFKDYQDYINQLSNINAVTNNHTRLHNQEFYSWNPHINWDMIINFHNYYWISNSSSKDYITIDRNSLDNNSWSNSNNWYHQDDIGDVTLFSRATRPIIQFESNIKLFNHGIKSYGTIDLIDIYTTDIFTTIEGSNGYIIDNVQVVDGMKILFTNDNNNKIYQIEYININGNNIIHLELLYSPVENDTIIANNKMYWFDGIKWILSQQKTSINQPPLFDILDSNNKSISSYNGSTFKGTKIFSYKIGNGTNDIELNFPLTYQKFSNIGGILFDFNLETDTFSYNGNKMDNIGNYYLFMNNSYVNGWITSTVKNIQASVRIYKNSNKVNNFDIDIFDDITALSDLIIHVYVNGFSVNNYIIHDTFKYKQVIFNNDVNLNDIITIRCFSKQVINSNGFYEIPNCFKNNPMNDDITANGFTLAEIKDHIETIVENSRNDFTGVFPGNGNLRNLTNLSASGTKFVKHSSPTSIYLYHLTHEYNNIINYLEVANNDYIIFKRAFIKTAENLGIDDTTKKQFDLVMSLLNKNKSNTQQYFNSDMIPYGINVHNSYIISDINDNEYPLMNNFDITTISFQAVNVYKNNIQLLLDHDYNIINKNSVILKNQLNINDVIDIYEYDSTKGSFVPETPTKLGIYPSFDPKIYIDTTLLTPKKVIQGHDGSITLAYSEINQPTDYRDDLLLELEKRIYNNIKVKYDSGIYDLSNIINSYNKITDYTLGEFNSIISGDFYKWFNNSGIVDFSTNSSYDMNNPFTYNYNNMISFDNERISGTWRNVFKYFYNTDRPNLTPWEIIGFNDKPSDWDSLYGQAPYTSDNLILWNYISSIKPFVANHIPVDENGNLLDPLTIRLMSGNVFNTTDNFIFGDYSPVENAWRRSSNYPFSIIKASIKMNPTQTIGLYLDRGGIHRNLANQIVYNETFLKSSNINVNTQTSGLINYFNLTKSYEYDLKNIQFKLSYRLGSFAEKSTIKLILDSTTPLATNDTFVPPEDYKLILNSSTAIKKLSYSGIIITKLNNGFQINGYNISNPYFTYYSKQLSGINVTIGGISSSYVNWDKNQQYIIGIIVSYNNKFYKTIQTHLSSNTFDSDKFAMIPSLPIMGGKSAIINKRWDKNFISILPYNSVLNTIQEVVDLLTGYGEWLKDNGFIFDEFDSNNETLSNWETSSKDFLFWTTQNWSAGNSVISLSPAANKIAFTTINSVVDDISNPFYEYNIVKVDGHPLSPEYLTSYRNNNEIYYTPLDNQAIYGATFHLIQKEQVLLINNTTLFNDVIYNPETGYKQDRIKISAFITTHWNGGMDIPGFIYDDAKIQFWNQYTDYFSGDIVKYQNNYYGANSFISGSYTFDMTNWTLLNIKPTAKLLPNWTNLATSFNYFYDVDNDNFDTNKQQFAQHLIGYQKRQYLDNIIKNDVSEFKFYQGMILDKGTNNVFHKLFDILSSDNKESIELYEEWAIRIANYGSTSSFETLELTLDQNLFNTNPQPIELISIDPKLNDQVIRYLPSGLDIKSFNYDSNPFLTTNNTYFRSAGYVRNDQAQLTIKNISDLLTTDITTLSDGNYIWITFYNSTWDILRFTNTNIVITNSTYTNNILTLTLMNNIFSVNNYIGIKQFDGINIFATINSISGNVITINTNTTLIMNSNQIEIYSLLTQRTDNINNANDVIYNLHQVEDETLFVDDISDGTWATYKNNSVYTKTQLYGSDQYMTISNDGTILLTTDNNTINIYLNGLDKQQFPNPYNGNILAISNDNTFIAIGSPNASNYTYTSTNGLNIVVVGGNNGGGTLTNHGLVSIYKKDINGNYNLLITIMSSSPTQNEHFGNSLAFNNSDLYIGSNGINAINKVNINTSLSYNGIITGSNNFGKIITTSVTTNKLCTIDNSNAYVYVNDSLYQTFTNRSNIKISNSGDIIVVSNGTTIDIYKLTNSGYILLQTINGNKMSIMNDKTIIIDNKVYDIYNVKFIISDILSSYDNITVGNNVIIINKSTTSGTYVINQYKKLGGYSWVINYHQVPKPDVNKIRRVFLYNKRNFTIIKYLDVIDALQGKISKVADEEISFKTFYDPAIYSMGNSTVNVDSGIAWNKKQVGKLWFDLRTIKFNDIFDNDIIYRNTNINSLAFGSSVDIYEWVESTLLPNDWDSIADTEYGLTMGISGLTLYGNNAYSIKQVYDKMGSSFKNVYYFWVKNKILIPNIQGRNISANDVANLIKNPKGENYEFIYFTNTNSFSLCNIKSSLNKNNTSLVIDYWITDTKNNAHSEWKIISEDPTTIIPSTTENKWIDSLVGKDLNDLSVPDIKLPIRNRYGIENFPRQGMFVNRLEVLKQIFEYINITMMNNPIVYEKDISKLLLMDIPINDTYDYSVFTYNDLLSLNMSLFKLPRLEAELSNGRIIGVNIIYGGNGYKVAPDLIISGDGKNAKIKTIINSNGSIIGYKIINSGNGYNNAIIKTRTFSVLVSNDINSFDNWAIYAYNVNKNRFDKSLVSTFDTTKYWSYINYYSTGFNSNTFIKSSVNNYIELFNMKDSFDVGDVIKIKLNKWVLVQRKLYNNMDDPTIWNSYYNIIGYQNGTIQFNESLYNYDNTIGFDSTIYDNDIYDKIASKELRIIFDCLKNDIFINDLKSNYINIFFISMRYILTEQLFCDWIFKTSFIKAKHNVGLLSQSVNYQNDNLSNFEDYINEVKPYRTKVRKYVSSYDYIDNGNIHLSDFDTPNSDDISIIDNNLLIKENSDWSNNFGYSLTDIILTNVGSGYTKVPTIVISGGLITNNVVNPSVNAIATATLNSNGSISVHIIDGGKGYYKIPNISINGTTGGTVATAIGKIGKGLVRNFKITQKFDRIHNKFYITSLNNNETFMGDGNTKVYQLKWNISTDINKTNITIDNNPVSIENFTTNKNGIITFNFIPKNNAVINISYEKSSEYLSAVDRIQFYSNIQLSNLNRYMSGIDYGGVIVNGFNFNVDKGYGSLPYNIGTWDGFQSTIDDYGMVVACYNNSTPVYTIPMPYLQNNGTEINVYYKNNDNLTVINPDNRTKNYNIQSYNNEPLISLIRTKSIITLSSTMISCITNDITSNTINAYYSTVETNNGSGAAFNVQRNNGHYIVSINTGGINYSVNDILYIRGNMIKLEGLTPDNDIIISITSVDSNGTIQTIDHIGTAIIKVIITHNNSAKVGMYVSGNGFNNSKIISISQDINNNHNDVFVLETPPTITPVNGNTIIFTYSEIGGYNINLSDVNDLYIGDIISANHIENNSIITHIDNVNNIITLNQILLNNLSDISTITIKHILTKHNDYTISSSNKLTLVNKIPMDAILHIEGEKNTVRIDDIYYATSKQKNKSAIMITPVNQRVDSVVITNTGSYTNVPEVIIPNSPLSIRGDLYNATVGTITMEIIGVNIINGGNNYHINDIIQTDNNTFTVLSVHNTSITSLMISDIPNNNFIGVLNNNIIDTSSTTGTGCKISYIYGVKSVQVLYSGNGYTDNLPLIFNPPSASGNIILTSNISIPTTLTTYMGDNYILRKSTSDGSVQILDNNYDTNLMGGDLAYQTATGINSNDIIIDGQQLISFENSQSAMEESIQGHITDSLIIKVKDSNHYSFMIFTDMLNRTHYTRLALYKQTTLASTLNVNDTTITVTNASNFNIPTKINPGVILIMGERIEYFSISGNVLSQLRRGTLGTGIKTSYNSGTYVQDIGISEIIPYSDNTIVEKVISDGSNVVPLSFIPIDKNSIEVFVGGYNISYWVSNTIYNVNDLIYIGSNIYRVMIECRSGNTYDKVETLDNNIIDFNSAMELFVNNIRLNKNSYSIHDINRTYISDSGDVQFPADFTVDGITNQITLNYPVSKNVVISVIRHTGVVFGNINTLNNSSSSGSISNGLDMISKFIKAKTGIS